MFVFSSLLTQHQFSAENFAIDALNRPDSAIHLEIRKAYLDLKAAAQRVEVASAAAVEALSRMTVPVVYFIANRKRTLP